MIKQLSGILILLGAISPVLAESITGDIVGITDGDTVTILDASNHQHRIRVAGIDAPELRQAFGMRSKQNLAQIAYRQVAVAECPKRDRYGRLVCKVRVPEPGCQGCGTTIDIGRKQLRDGMAWWYRAYSREQSVKDRIDYERDESEARMNKRGLWVDHSPVPPWELRNKK